MKKILGIILISWLVGYLAGCSAVKSLDTSNEYKNVAAHDNMLAIPKDINTSSIKNEYPVPDIDNKYYAVSTVPPGSKLQ